MSNNCRCCDCLPVVQCQDCPTTPPCEDCLTVTSPVVTCENSVDGCNKTAMVEITSNDEDATFTVIAYDSAFTNVSFTDNILSFTTVQATATPGQYFDITYRVNGSDGKSVIGRARICIKNLCINKCGVNEVCDPCTGDCDPAPDEVFILT